MDKRTLTECDICTKFVLPALRNAGWDEMLQIPEEVSFTKGRIILRGKAKKFDIVLYYHRPNVAIWQIKTRRPCRPADAQWRRNHTRLLESRLQNALDVASNVEVASALE